MTEENLQFLYKGRQFNSIVSLRECEYTGCTSPTEKIMVIADDIWQFCSNHCNKVVTMFLSIKE